MPWDVKDQCDGFRIRPRFIVVFRVCDDYFGLHISICDLNLIRTNLNSAIGSRLIRLVRYELSISSKTISKSQKCWPKILDFFIARYLSLSDVRVTIPAKRKVGFRFFKTAKVFAGANQRTLLIHSRERTVLEIYLMSWKYTFRSFCDVSLFRKYFFPLRKVIFYVFLGQGPNDDFDLVVEIVC